MAYLASKVRTCLRVNGRGEEAARFYVSLLPRSELDAAPMQMVTTFTLAGAPMMILDAQGAPAPSAAASISVITEDQAETDRLWAALTADGGAESRCGWLTDRFGISWQIVPRRLIECNTAPDREAAGRAFQAMLTMRKIDIAAIEAAFQGTAT
jgi:predicted 3-demethylubiquinone-9 3-methyltransferase (glyoxalase superfamily)